MKSAPFNRWFMLAMITIACSLLVTLFAVQMFMNGNANAEVFAQCNPIVMSSLNNSLENVTDDIDTSLVNGKNLCGDYIISPNKGYALSIIKNESTTPPQWEVRKWVLEAKTVTIVRGTVVFNIPATPQMTSVRIALENGQVLVKSTPDNKIQFKFNGNNAKALAITNEGKIVTLNKDLEPNVTNIPPDSIIEETPTDTLFFGEIVDMKYKMMSPDRKVSLDFSQVGKENVIAIKNSGKIVSYLYRTAAPTDEYYLKLVVEKNILSLNLYSLQSDIPIARLASILYVCCGLRLQLQSDGIMRWVSDSPTFIPVPIAINCPKAVDEYLQRNADVRIIKNKENIATPFDVYNHYVTTGAREGRVWTSGSC
jgi:hypothetical protein